MLARLAIAAVGGIVVTTAMLLMMSDFTQRLREHDSLRYFPITDFIPATGTSRPRPPPAPPPMPERPRPEFAPHIQAPLDADRPVAPAPLPVERGAEPTLDPSLVTPDAGAPP